MVTRERALKVLAREVRTRLGSARMWLAEVEEGGEAMSGWGNGPCLDDERSECLREQVRALAEQQLELAEVLHMAAEALEAKWPRPEAAHAFVPADVGPLCCQCGGTADGHLRFALEAMTGGHK